MSYDTSQRQLSNRPLEADDVREFINRELVPLLVQWRLAYNALVSAINAGSLQVGSGATVMSGSGVPVAAPPTARAIYIRSDGGGGSTLYVYEGGAWVGK